jgi:DNA-binding transcriptional LysR family regulator
MNILASLRYLVALNEHKHFGRAAQACHITQPALSNALRSLEAEYKVVIVKRGRTFSGLTPEGVRVLATAQRMLQEHAMLQQELESSEHAPQGGLVIGAVPTAMPIATRFAAQLHAMHAGVRPMLRSMSSQEIEEGLDALSIDIAFGYSDRPNPRGLKLVRHAQYEERYFVLSRADAAGTKKSPALIGEPITWAQAASLPLCLLAPEMHNRAIIDRAFAEAGATVTPAIETNSTLALAISVLSGNVSSILPGALVGFVRSLAEQAPLQARPLTTPNVITPIGLLLNDATRRSRTAEAALAFAISNEWLSTLSAHSGLLRQ